MVTVHSDSERENPLLTHGLLFQVVARDLLYPPSPKQDSISHSLCGALTGTKNSTIGPP